MKYLKHVIFALVMMMPSDLTIELHIHQNLDLRECGSDLEILPITIPTMAVTGSAQRADLTTVNDRESTSYNTIRSTSSNVT